MVLWSVTQSLVTSLGHEPKLHTAHYRLSRTLVCVLYYVYKHNCNMFHTHTVAVRYRLSGCT